MNPQRRQHLRLAATWAVGGAGLSAGLTACQRREPLAGAGPTPPAHWAELPGGWVGPNMARGHAWRDGRPQVASAPPHPAPDRRVHTLVLGAGVGGLSAAHHLMRAGIDDLAVIDLDDQPGGNAQGHRLGGLACPLGAHYLPMPGPQATDVQAWLAEIGLIRWAEGRWQADERHACHDPQERLFVPDAPRGQPPASGLWRQGRWHDGLWPGAGDQRPAPAVLRQWRQLADAIAALQRQGQFAMPTHAVPWTPALQALDAITFADWLDAQQLTDPGLRWLMDYVCRDDYGASAQRVSAWAGLHYFASRHGLRLPEAWGGAPHDDSEPILTWAEGNGWLTQKLAAPLGERWHPGEVAVAVRDGREVVSVDTVSARTGQAQRWQARHVVLALPLTLAHRLLDARPAPLQTVQPWLDTAPWLVSNLLLRAPLDARPGEALSWDNVFFDTQGVAGLPPSLGYVNARHQSLSPPVGPSLLTHYWALGGGDGHQGQAWRRALHGQPWQDWAWRVCQDLARVHPDLPDKLLQADLKRHGHAMVVPRPGLRSQPALPAMMRPQGVSGRLHFAHADLSAYSVFEEAFTHGARVARQIRQGA